MIDRVIAYSIRYRWLVIGASALLAVLGVVAAATAPIDAIPDLSETQVIVYAEWPGRDPFEIEREVTSPLAKALHAARGVRTIRSSSDAGAAWIYVIFDETQDIRAARQAVSERLASVQPHLPSDAALRLAPDAPATGQIFWYTVEGGQLDLGRLRELHDERIRPRLAEVPGVAEVASVGGFAIECQIALDPQRLLASQVGWSGALTAIERAIWNRDREPADDSNSAASRVEAVGNVAADPRPVPPDITRLPVPTLAGETVPLDSIADVAWGPGPRRGILEQDGSEAVGGVVMMGYGQNPVAVIRALRAQIAELSATLPNGVHIVASYDRTPLVQEAVGTVVRTLLEAIVTAVLLVVLVMRHWRASLVIALALPLAVLGAFVALAALRATGVADIATNIMSLAGIVISIGVLVDASIVMTENVLHQLEQKFQGERVVGDVRPQVERACQSVGRPIFFSVLIMLLSFLPVFALHGLEGKMFRPLAITKSLVLAMVALLAITLVPALCSLLVRGRLRGERENWLVRNLIDAYRPLLAWLLEHPVAIYWWVGITLMAGAAPLGQHPVWLASWLSPLGTLSERPFVLLALIASFVAVALAARSHRSRWPLLASLVLVALVVDRMIQPLSSEFLTPLDERTVMDMPISVPRMTARQAVDDLKARDMLLCRFPEVDMVMGKAGRADTPTDPAPIEMIETMISFRPEELWPRRHLDTATVRHIAQDIAAELGNRKLTDAATMDAAAADDFVESLVFRFDALMREYCYQRFEEYRRSASRGPTIRVERPRYDAGWQQFGRQVDRELAERAPGVLVRLTLEHQCGKLPVSDEQLRTELRQLAAFRLRSARATRSAGHHSASNASADYEPLPVLDGLQSALTERWAPRISLSRCRREDLIGFGGEFDRHLQMPGWANVWTMPIQNRVDMLATGINTTIGVRVLGDRLEDVWQTSERVAKVLHDVPGAREVVADPILGKPSVQIDIDSQRVDALHVAREDVVAVAELATTGRVAGVISAAGPRRDVRVLLTPAAVRDFEALGRVAIPAGPLPVERARGTGISATTLDQVATIRLAEGPAAIKGENGRLRNYVRLNVRDRDPLEFIEEARRVVAEQVVTPPGVQLEWTGQFEHQLRARRTLLVVLPVVVLLIGGILYWTYRDLADAMLMLLAVPGAAAGGMLFQWAFGYKFSVNVWIGYIACFGMATSTGIVMLVYLREALESAGGLGRLTIPELKEVVLRGATQRLRPKLLTEATTLLSLAPMLLATGVGSEVIRPMAAPVLGGILVADEVIDLFLPVMFYAVRLRRWRRLHGISAADESESLHPTPPSEVDHV